MITQPGTIEWKSIQVRMPAEAKAEIAEVALRKGLSQTAVINTAISDYLRNERLLHRADTQADE